MTPATGCGVVGKANINHMKLTQTLGLLILSFAMFGATIAHAEGDKADKAEKSAEKKATALIEKYDTNGDGSLSADELAKALTDKAIVIKGEKKPKKDASPEGEQ